MRPASEIPPKCEILPQRKEREMSRVPLSNAWKTQEMKVNKTDS